MAEKPTIPDFPNLPDFGQMITQACELVASVRGIPYDFNGTLSLENKFVILFKTVKEMFEAQTSLIKSYKELYEFIKSYFDNLDVQEEINKKINQMVIDGTLLPIMSPAISSETTKWLSTNITNPSNPPIDKSLTVTGAAADARTCGDYSFLFAVTSNFSSFSVPFTHDDKSITFTVNCSDGYLFTMHNYFYAKDLNGRSGTYTYKKPFAGDTFVVTFRPSDTSVHVYQISEFIPITDVIIYSIALHRDFTVITEVFSVLNTYDSTLTSTNNAANARIAGNFANKFAVSSNFSSFSVPFTHDDKSITFTVNCSDGYLFTMHNYFYAKDLNGRSGTYTYKKPFAGDTFVVTFRPSDTSVHVYQISEFIPITDVIIYSIALHRDFTVITEVFSVLNTYDSTLTSTNNAANARIAGNFANKFAVSSNFSSFSVPFTHDDKSITFTVNCSDGYLFTMHNYFYAKDLNGRSGTYTYKKPFAGDTFVVTFRPSDTSVHVYQISEFIPITDVIIYSIALHRDFTVITEVFSVLNTYDSTLTSTNNAANARIAGNFANKFAVSSNFSSFSVPFTHDDKSITFTVNCSDGYLFTMHNYFYAKDLNGRSGTYTYKKPFAGDTFVVTFRPSDTSVHVYQISEFIPITDVIIYSIALHRDFTVITEVFSVFKEKTTVPLSTNNLGDTTFSIFNKVVCCGDSYTSGYIKTSSSRTETNENYSWVKYISSITGNKFINCGSSGTNVLTWQSAERGLIKAKSSGVSQCYTIGLGLNDSSNTERHVDIGTTNDIDTDNETYYGGYSKIIRELHAISPKSFIFCFTMPFENDSNAPYNEAIVNICNSYKSTYKTYLVDLRKYTNYYKFSTVTNNAVGGHYSPAGYQQMAEIACKAISDCINKNYIDFYDVNLIPYDE